MDREIKRKAIHAMGISSIALIYIIGKLYAALAMLAVSLAFLFIDEYMKNKDKYRLVRSKKMDEFEETVEEELNSFNRSKEKPFHGAITFYMGCFIVTFLFQINIAIASIAVLALADALSTLIGHFLGKHKLPVNKKKTWEGSITFFLTALTVLYFFTNPLKAIVIAALVTGVEMLPKIDDNISIPVATGILLFLL
ncbi:MAG: diacylglycerol/polyprenol kinase family protein [Candidatus Aenigmatarchaeota archaeon]